MRTDRRRAQRMVLWAGVVTLPLVVDRTLVSAVDVPKLSVLLLLALALLALESVTWVRGDVPRSLGSAPRPVRAGYWSIAGLVMALLVTTALSTVPSISVWGVHPRSTGVVFYLAVITCGVVAFLSVGSRDGGHLSLSFVVALALISAYAVLQGLGADPLQWDIPVTGAYATLGNPNILAGFVAIGSPFALHMCWADVGWRRALGLSTLLLALPAVYFAASAQGPLALLAGVVVYLVVVFAPNVRGADLGPRRKPVLVGIAGLLALGIVAAFLVGPGLVEQGLVERQHFYQAAIDMFLSRPLLGVGLGLFGVYFSRFRPLEHAQLVGGDTADSVHSIFLSTLAEGGIILFTPYITFVVVVGVAAVGVARAHPDRRMVAAVIGSWAAYQVQALVSIENPTLGFIHFLLAGVILRLRWEVDGVPNDVPSKRKRPQKKPAPAWALVAAVLPVIVLGWFASVPYRAERALAAAAAASNEGDLDGALDGFDRAEALRPEVGEYYFQHAGLLQQVDRLEESYAVLTQGAERAAGSVELPAAAGLVAESLGGDAEAERWYVLALARDPFNPVVLRAAAEQREAAGDRSGAARLYERALTVTPDDVELRDAIERLES